MMHPPDLYSRTGMSTSLHFALSLGLRSLLDLHHTEEQLSSTDSFALAQASSCAKSCANALRSSTGVVGAPSWGEAPQGSPCRPYPIAERGALPCGDSGCSSISSALPAPRSTWSC